MTVQGYAENVSTDVLTWRHGVVRIEVGISMSDDSWSDAKWEPISRGTGFFVGNMGENPQYIVTNRHVIEDYLEMGQGERIDLQAESGEVVHVRSHIRIYFDANDYTEAFLVEAGNTQDRDVAILRLSEPTDKRAPLPIEVPTDALAGSTVYALGFPGVADNESVKSMTSASEKDVVVTKGEINKLFTQTGTGIQTIQHSATIHPGNSGGPLVLEDKGSVIGINTWSVNSTTANEPMYYAVGMDFIKPYLDRNNIPYSTGSETMVPGPSTAPSETPETSIPSEPPVPPDHHTNWVIYAIFGAAIIGVIVFLIILLRRPNPNPEPKPNPQPQPEPQKPSAPPKRVLVGIEGPLKDRQYTLEKGGKLRIGRDQSCNVRFKDGTPGVSKIHCEIRFDGKTATITDLKSSYGTYVDHKKLDPNVTVTLHRSLAIDIGTEKNRFVLQ